MKIMEKNLPVFLLFEEVPYARYPLNIYTKSNSYIHIFIFETYSLPNNDIYIKNFEQQSCIYVYEKHQ